MEIKDIVKACLAVRSLPAEDRDYPALRHINVDLARTVIEALLSMQNKNKWHVIYRIKAMFPMIDVLDVMQRAFEIGSFEYVCKLIDLNKDDKVLINESLLQAVYALKYAWITKIIKDYKADVNYISEIYTFGEVRSTIWSIIIHHKNALLAKIVLELGADIEMPLDCDGQTPLDIARIKSKEVAHYLEGVIEERKAVAVVENLTM